MVVNEMLTSDVNLWHTSKSQNRLSWGEPSNSPTIGPKVIQIAGSEPLQMATAARACELNGAEIIDINMGCPAKKVCNKAAGSALLQDEALVAKILAAVVNAVSLPVTLKIRTGWDTENRNAVQVARIAEQQGIQALTIHGRTRACRFKGLAEYDTIAETVQNLSIPVIANGDIHSPEKAKYILDYTGASALMIGRAAQGNPWLFNQIEHFLASGERKAGPSIDEVEHEIVKHLQAIHHFYGDFMGVRIARKHFAWYTEKQVPLIQRTERQDLNLHNRNLLAAHGDELVTQDLNAAVQNLPENSVCIDVKHWRQRFNNQTIKQQQIEVVRNFFEHLQLLKDQAA